MKVRIKKIGKRYGLQYRRWWHCWCYHKTITELGVISRWTTGSLYEAENMKRTFERSYLK